MNDRKEKLNLLLEEERQVINELEALIERELNVVHNSDEGHWLTPFIIMGEENRITELCLARFPIVTLPESIQNLKHLRWLSLSRANLSVIPDIIGELRMLEELHLGKNPLKNLPEILGDLIHLKVLTLNDTKLSKFPDFIRKLKNLRELDIFNTYIPALPNYLYSMENLKKIYISKNTTFSSKDSSIYISTKRQGYPRTAWTGFRNSWITKSKTS